MSKMISQSNIKLVWIQVILGIGLIMIAACVRQPVYPAPEVRGNEVVVDLSALEPAVPLFLTYKYNGKNISFFVISLDGNVLSFLDACATCYRHKQGYRYEEGFVTCRYCNMNFSLHKLEKGLGGCYPIKIEGAAVDREYRIPTAVLESKAYFF
jgi:uncharacterized membrane protein